MAHWRLQQGQAAELLAANYLQARGLKILARNLRCKGGELDLVCLDERVLAIVEVRQRETREFGGPLASVTWSKRRKILRAAKYFLRQNSGWHDLALRFDVLAVEGLPGGTHRIEWVKDAFRGS